MQHLIVTCQMFGIYQLSVIAHCNKVSAFFALCRPNTCFILMSFKICKGTFCREIDQRRCLYFSPQVSKNTGVFSMFFVSTFFVNQIKHRQRPESFDMCIWSNISHIFLKIFRFIWFDNFSKSLHRILKIQVSHRYFMEICWNTNTISQDKQPF